MLPLFHQLLFGRIARGQRRQRWASRTTLAATEPHLFTIRSRELRVSMNVFSDIGKTEKRQEHIGCAADGRFRRRAVLLCRANMARGRVLPTLTTLSEMIMLCNCIMRQEQELTMLWFKQHPHGDRPWSMCVYNPMCLCLCVCVCTYRKGLWLRGIYLEPGPLLPSRVQWVFSQRFEDPVQKQTTCARIFFFLLGTPSRG